MLIQFYSEEVTQEYNSSLIYRFYRAAKRPEPEAVKPKRKRKKLN